jgi:alcohol dehydrogenase
VDLQKACGVAELKVSDYGITLDEFDKIATNARKTMGGLFVANPCEIDHEDVVNVLKKSYR